MHILTVSCIFLSLHSALLPTPSIVYNGILCISTLCITNTLTVLLITQYIVTCTILYRWGDLSLVEIKRHPITVQIPIRAIPNPATVDGSTPPDSSLFPIRTLVDWPTLPHSAGVGLVIDYPYLFPAHQNHVHYTLFTGNYTPIKHRFLILSFGAYCAVLLFPIRIISGIQY